MAEQTPDTVFPETEAGGWAFPGQPICWRGIFLGPSVRLGLSSELLSFKGQVEV